MPNDCQGKGRKNEFVKEKNVLLCIPDVYGRGRAGGTCLGRGCPLLCMTSMIEDKQDEHAKEEDVLSCT